MHEDFEEEGGALRAWFGVCLAVGIIAAYLFASHWVIGTLCSKAGIVTGSGAYYFFMFIGPIFAPFIVVTAWSWIDETFLAPRRVARWARRLESDDPLVLAELVRAVKQEFIDEDGSDLWPLLETRLDRFPVEDAQTVRTAWSDWCRRLEYGVTEETFKAEDYALTGVMEAREKLLRALGTLAQLARSGLSDLPNSLPRRELVTNSNSAH